MTSMPGTITRFRPTRSLNAPASDSMTRLHAVTIPRTSPSSLTLSPTTV